MPNIERRGPGRSRAASAGKRIPARPRRVEKFLAEDRAPKAIFLNSPHNPTGGVATETTCEEIADLVRGKNVAVFSDEPYCHMVWKGRHRSLLAQPGMLDQCVAAYTFSKSYSMSGWRLGFAVRRRAIADAIGKMINTLPVVRAADRATGGSGGPRARPVERDG